MAWPSANVSLANVDSGSDRISSARADIYDAFTKLNEIITEGPGGGGGGSSTSIVVKSTDRYSDSPVIGTELLIHSILIPANTFVDGDIIEIFVRHLQSDTSVIRHRVGFNTTASLSGITRISGYRLPDFSSTGTAQQIQKTLFVEAADGTGNGTTGEQYSDGSELESDINEMFLTSYAIDWTVDQYLIFSVQRYSGTSSMTAGIAGYYVNLT